MKNGSAARAVEVTERTQTVEWKMGRIALSDKGRHSYVRGNG